jgi:hypothetical protein
MGETFSDYGRSLAIRILEWMACSCRVLKTYELIDGITLSPNCTEINARTQMSKDVLELCMPLVEEGPGSTMSFVHFSAKE